MKPALPAPISGFTCPPAPALPARFHLPSCRFPGFTCPPASLPWVSTKDDLVWPVTSGTRGMVQIGCDFWGKPAMTCDFWEWGSGNTGVTCDFWASAQETRA